MCVSHIACLEMVLKKCEMQCRTKWENRHPDWPPPLNFWAKTATTRGQKKHPSGGLTSCCITEAKLSPFRGRAPPTPSPVVHLVSPAFSESSIDISNTPISVKRHAACTSTKLTAAGFPYRWQSEQPAGSPAGWWSCHKACSPTCAQRCWPARWRWGSGCIAGVPRRSSPRPGTPPRSTRAPAWAPGSRASQQTACNAWFEDGSRSHHHHSLFFFPPYGAEKNVYFEYLFVQWARVHRHFNIEQDTAATLIFALFCAVCYAPYWNWRLFCVVPHLGHFTVLLLCLYWLPLTQLGA